MTVFIFFIFLIPMVRWTIEGPPGEGGAVYISTSERLAGAVSVINFIIFFIMMMRIINFIIIFVIIMRIVMIPIVK